MTALADADRRRLLALVGMTGSHHDGEALNALCLAARDSRGSWQVFAHRCLTRHARRLSNAQRQLCTSLVAQRGSRPTLQQHVMLQRISARCAEPLPGAPR
jgi:hypothetical protein